MQRHLNQARAAECALNETGSEGGRPVAKGFCRGCDSRNRALPLATAGYAGLQIRAEAGIQTDVVIRRVETRMVEEVEELSVIAKGEAFVQLKKLEDAEVETRLKWSAECVAAGAGKSRFREIASSTAVSGRAARGHTVGTWGVHVDAERAAIKDRLACVYAGGALKLGALGGPVE